MSDRYELFLTCPKGLEGLLAEEATALGLQETREHTSAIRGSADMETAYRLCLWSRLANRVLLVLKRFPMKDAEDLYHGVLDVEWQDHLESDGTIAVEFSGHGSGIDNTHFGALKVKDAIVDKLRTPDGERPSVDKINPDLRVHLRLDRGEAILSLDLSGHSLHQRGYRLQQGAAPLKENLAAAILIRAGWPRIAAEGGALADPMCGVGTFLVEAGMIAADIAPNIKRERWGFSAWLGHVPALWRKLHDEALARAETGLAKTPSWIRGYEADPRLIQPGRNNIERAGLSDWIKVYQGEVATFEPRPDQNQKGLVICNPPYGERLGDEASLLYLYQNLGERLRQACLNWEAAVFTGAPDLGKRMGIRSHKQYSFWNGALPCKLLLIKVTPDQFVTGERRTPEQRQIERENPVEVEVVERKLNKNGNPIKPEPVVVEQARLSEGGQMFANRLQKNLKLMGKWVRREGIDCYRVYDADMPEYSLAIDLYHDWVHVQEYAAPKSIDPEKASARLFDALAAIPQALNIDKNRVVIKRRERQSGTKQYERQSAQGQFLEVSEGGVKLLVNLTDYLDTGLFLDHRPMRMRIQREAAGKRFLNLFAYTATASVHAAKGGARSTTSVDLSRTYLDWARRNLSLNGFSDKNRLEQGDVMAWLQANRDEYDLIFIDPPTFSNSKRMEGIFDVQRDQVELIDLAMARLAPGGVLYFSNNFRKFVLDENLSQRYAVEDITAQTIDQDFARNGKIHRAWKIMARS
ncbi:MULTISPECIES: bifunctional 23S rRNA (guanine(2069)-N(7))-methyltransferase RlmK/23S rRNA (guanine(2445)-N(2))-methyltransferase RlmL [Pseudomonas]|jgi:23S rRNA (guanine2445-N2)-methyltransferase / 23S rRNA (guanine2069-N7)-methyltransferase|uniref:bifunctional 23S rRNA (guanine(2069)-N(7))-methyltransferase RlmK/23S rRNA (guanine(2445)-N(2))-methyltransferase RlmL n=1 Tax=Pseudomonas TaxID=286 RepID=UPI0008E32F1D|nr:MULTISPECIES: bifunctional 23S rRNA (guanine(2069)-N(7))-methyltransferase RlmK/23S rRNA (guanine(2445)-N(2))-methyltransferase RlmL [Pseudomonas]MBI6672196.1 bifunctional 23S rRNA (guanine(2069)-N(7))-methyltransferase RlmK/23S rRNA (guanine(2445)-N(2))-methyltransferase RlmL [Pseudomonas syringae]MBP1140872.1 23S rRNA (guanine2445-N2)-methyltransferase / 23S rRNA (guanine2069-N7)-methyltransferase [Pseudomonas sp. PvP009]POD33933.1 23S rRNA (guanine(2445)-N(2))/(guanine(2069)-N(7))-methyltr